jgi:hypothetical protein
MPEVLEERSTALENDGMIVDDEDPCHGCVARKIVDEIFLGADRNGDGDANTLVGAAAMLNWPPRARTRSPMPRRPMPNEGWAGRPLPSSSMRRHSCRTAMPAISRTATRTDRQSLCSGHSSRRLQCTDTGSGRRLRRIGSRAGRDRARNGAPEHAAGTRSRDSRAHRRAARDRSPPASASAGACG